jgi:uncharacterized protein YndB with AHSA1/START domain
VAQEDPMSPTLFLLVASPAFAGTHTAMGAQQFQSEIVINAAPAAVWTKLTDATQMAKVFASTTTTATTTKVDKVGATLALKTPYDTGNLVVIGVKPQSELKVAFSPDNASYICASRFVLTPSGATTKVTLDDRYTESGAQKAEDLDAQVRDLDAGLAALKAAVEGGAK